MAIGKKLDYKTLTLEDMFGYIEANCPEKKAEFKKHAFIQRKRKKAVKQFNEDGTPKMKTDKNGVERQITKMVEIADSEAKPVFSLLDAKKYFVEHVRPDLKPQKKESLVDKILNEW